jgi:CBS domain-containing protein
MKVSEALTQVDSLPYLTVEGDCTLEEISDRIKDQRQARGIYVVDAEGRLIGALSLGVLIRHLTAARRRPVFHVRSLLTRLTSAQVVDLMEKHVLYARPEEDLHEVLDRMIRGNIKEIPVVNEDRRLMAVLSLLDLWRLAGASSG